MTKPYDPFSADSRKKSANKREKRLSRKMGANRHPASGALDSWGGDFSDADFCYDSKQNPTNIKRDLVKLTKDAKPKIPALVVNFDPCPPEVDNEWVCIPMEIFLKMKGKV